MKLRLARKIAKTIGKESRYSEGLQNKALDRLAKTKEEREANGFWHATMDLLGVRGRAEVLAGSGAPAMAFDLLMRTPEVDWTYGPTVSNVGELERGR